MFGLFPVIEEVIRYAVRHFVVGRFTVVIVYKCSKGSKS